MGRFSLYLQKRRLVTAAQLEEALQHQAVYGARLGTALVELRMIGIEQLAEALSDFHKIPLPPRKWLESPQRPAVKRVSRPLVERLRFIPMRLDGNLLHAALLDPRDPRLLDDLRFATGCRIEPYVLPEIWMHDWLYSLFDIPRGIRHVEPASERPVTAAQPFAAVQIGHGEPEPVKPAAAPARAAAAPISVPAPMQQPAARRTEPEARVGPHQARAALRTAPEASAPEPRRTGASVRPPAPPVHSLAEIAAAMARPDFGKYAEPPVAEHHDPAFWRQPAPYQAQAATFSDAPEVVLQESAPSVAPAPAPVPEPKLKPEPATPVPARERRRSTLPPPTAPAPPPPSLHELEAELQQVADRERLIEIGLAVGSQFARRLALFIVSRGLIQAARCAEAGTTRAFEGVVPADADSMLTLVVNGAQALRADPRVRAIDQHVLQLLGDESAREVALFPVAVNKRVVNVLYASNADRALGPIAFTALEQLSEQLGNAYGRLIMSRKAAAS